MKNRTAKRETQSPPVRIPLDIPADLAAELQQQAANTPLPTLIVRILDEHGGLPLGERNPIFLTDDQRSRITKALGGGEAITGEAITRMIEAKVSVMVGPFKLSTDAEVLSALMVCNPNGDGSRAGKVEWITHLFECGLAAVREGSVVV